MIEVVLDDADFSMDVNSMMKSVQHWQNSTMM